VSSSVIGGSGRGDISATGKAVAHGKAALLPTHTMPTVPDNPGLDRFFFYSFDCMNPRHVHVRCERMVWKFWLSPVVLSTNHGYSPRELNHVRAIILDNLHCLLDAWHDHRGE
jgi:hypothetical protein